MHILKWPITLLWSMLVASFAFVWVSITPRGGPVQDLIGFELLTGYSESAPATMPPDGTEDAKSVGPEMKNAVNDARAYLEQTRQQAAVAPPTAPALKRSPWAFALLAVSIMGCLLQFVHGRPKVIDAVLVIIGAALLALLRLSLGGPKNSAHTDLDLHVEFGLGALIGITVLSALAILSVARFVRPTSKAKDHSVQPRNAAAHKPTAVVVPEKAQVNVSPPLPEPQHTPPLPVTATLSQPIVAYPTDDRSTPNVAGGPGDSLEPRASTPTITSSPESRVTIPSQTSATEGMRPAPNHPERTTPPEEEPSTPLQFFTRVHQPYPPIPMIIGKSITPCEQELSVRSYVCSQFNSRFFGIKARGILEVTNKRLIFQALGEGGVKGWSVIHNEVAIMDVADIKVYKGSSFNLKLFLLGIAVTVSVASFLTMILSQAMEPWLATILAFGAGIYFIVKILYPWCNRDTFSLVVNTKGGGGNVVHLVGQSPFGSGGTAAAAALMAAPGPDSEKLMKELGAVVNDIQSMGDFGIEKWQRMST